MFECGYKKFSKIFEPDLCPLPFETNKVYEFISSRLMKGNYEETLDALDWLHVSYCLFEKELYSKT